MDFLGEDQARVPDIRQQGCPNILDQSCDQTLPARGIVLGDSFMQGMFVGDSDRYFTLTRYKMNCCAADALPLNAVIMLDEQSKEKIPYKELRKKWVRVTGRVQFLNRKGQGGFLPALIVYPTAEEPLSKLIEEIPPDPDPYAN